MSGKYYRITTREVVVRVYRIGPCDSAEEALRAYTEEGQGDQVGDEDILDSMRIRGPVEEGQG